MAEAYSAAGSYGFALAGGYAVQAHGFRDRPSADVDIFTTAPDNVTCIVADIVHAAE